MDDRPAYEVGAAMQQVVMLQQVTKQYELRGTPVRVLDGVDLSVAEGSTLALVGASGSGKSTLLSLVAGLERPNAGTVMTAGVDISRMKPRQLSYLRFCHIGFIFQQYHLIPTLTAIENVMLPCVPWTVDYDPRKRAAELLGLVGLGDRLHHLPAQLSGGEQQRVCIARALINRPTLLLADEPTGNLDAESAADVLRLIQAMSGQFNTTLLVATHDMGLACQLGRVVRVQRGALLEVSGRQEDRSIDGQR
ncbi:MAG TPA: ABC transporter ATP-binding protein [Symbiobacteriaceae bacterium]|nr:ABC transporter ATP-binding protein [Symbiobacteriaceae bacterium]